MPFAPTDLTGLQLWLKADSGAYSDAGVTPAVNGGTVQQWSDLSGNGNHYSQATSGNRPSYVAGAVSGLPVVRSPGSKWLHSSANFNFFPLTAWVVVVVRTHRSTLCGLWATDQGGGAWGQGVTLDAANSFRGMYTSGLIGLPFIPVIGAPYAVEVDWTGSAPGAAGIQGWVDGIQLAQFGYTYTSGAVANTTGSDLFTLQNVGGYGSIVDIGEVIVQSGGTTPTDRANVKAYLDARWGTGTPPSSWPSTPYYMYSGFAVGESLRMFGSTDGVNFVENPVNTYGPPVAGANVRDPAVLRYAGKWWLAHTSTVGLSGGTSFAVASSDDRITWTHVADVDCSSLVVPSTGHTWAPKWYTDPLDGLPRVFINLSLAAGDKACEVHPTNIGMTAWSAPVQVTGTGFPTNIIDAFVVKVGSTYYIWFKNESGPWIEVVSSSSLLSGYTALYSGDWLGIGSGPEGPSVVRKPDGVWRVYFDNVTGSGGFGGMCWCDQTAGDWTAGGSTTWSSKAATQCPPYTIGAQNGGTRHGMISLVPTPRDGKPMTSLGCGA